MACFIHRRTLAACRLKSVSLPSSAEEVEYVEYGGDGGVVCVPVVLDVDPVRVQVASAWFSAHERGVKTQGNYYQAWMVHHETVTHTCL